MELHVFYLKTIFIDYITKLLTLETMGKQQNYQKSGWI